MKTFPCPVAVLWRMAWSSALLMPTRGLASSLDVAAPTLTTSSELTTRRENPIEGCVLGAGDPQDDHGEAGLGLGQAILVFGEGIPARLASFLDRRPWSSGMGPPAMTMSGAQR